MVKAADALAAAGHDVRVVSTRHMGWAAQADADMKTRRPWRWRVVDYARETAPVMYAMSGIRRRLACAAVRRLGSASVSFSIAIRAYARVHPELVRAAVEERVDLFYGGTTGALAAAAEASARTGAPYGLDLEDLHSAEQDGPDSALINALAARIETRVLPSAAFLTASSGPIVAEYQRRYGVDAVTVHNTFPLPSRLPDVHPRDGGPLKTYWFSQTIGPGRGLEDFVHGAALADVPVELHLRGVEASGYLEQLRRLASMTAPRLTIATHDPGTPDSMIDLCREYEIGLALEANALLNRQVCLTNKAFTYILAGLAVVFTDTEGQRPLAEDLGAGALLYRSGNHSALAQGLRRWYQEPARLLEARRAAWAAAVRRWHWEHPAERGALTAAVDRALS
jgi:glycosyl transferase family 4